MNAPARLIIRPEQPGDQEAIRLLVAGAFGQEDEAGLVDALRKDGDLILSFVAEGDDPGLCGHVALSRLMSPGNSLALAPLSVTPALQRKGIGSRLVRVALTRARQQGAALVFVLGDPAYYARFGFTAEAAKPFPSPYAGSHFMALRLLDTPVEPAPVVYADAFARLG